MPEYLQDTTQWYVKEETTMKGANEVSNTENVLDRRDIIDIIEYLEREREALTAAVDQAQEALNDLAGDQFEEVSAFEEAED